MPQRPFRLDIEISIFSGIVIRWSATQLLQSISPRRLCNWERQLSIAFVLFVLLLFPIFFKIYCVITNTTHCLLIVCSETYLQICNEGKKMTCRSGNYIVQNDRKRPKRLKRNLEVTGFTSQRVQKTKSLDFRLI